MLSVLMLSACGTGEEEDEMENDFENASGVTWLSNGWNLGNTLDACSYGSKTNKDLSTETGWNMPETTKEMIQAVAAQGFKSIRVPISWHNHITDSNYTIDSEWIARVKEIVDWSLDAELKVIINIHHDNLTESQMNSTYGFCVTTNTTLKNQSNAYITAVWKQISATFKDYDARLVFELLNEPRCRDASNDGFTAPSNLSACNSVITQYEQAALDVIRASGGNNASRYVMVPPYAASPDQTSGWSLPTDSAKGKLIVSLHAYTPYRFAMYDGTDHTTFTSQDEGEITWLFNSIKTNYISKGIPVIIGEASASNKNNDGDRKKWANAYFGKAKALGIPVVLWDNMNTNGSDLAERHGYFNRKNLTWYFPELVNVMVGNN